MNKQRVNEAISAWFEPKPLASWPIKCIPIEVSEKRFWYRKLPTWPTYEDMKREWEWEPAENFLTNHESNARLKRAIEKTDCSWTLNFYAESEYGPARFDFAISRWRKPEANECLSASADNELEAVALAFCKAVGIGVTNER